MPAGDQITDNGQFEVGGVLYGYGTIWETDPAGWSILGVSVQDRDMDLAMADGARSTVDRNQKRVCGFPIWTNGTTPAEAFAAAYALEQAWGAGGDVELHFQLDGLGHCSVVGRTRGTAIDLRDAPSGIARALCTFVAGDPTITVEGS